MEEAESCGSIASRISLVPLFVPTTLRPDRFIRAWLISGKSCSTIILEAAVVRQNLLEELAQRRMSHWPLPSSVDRASDRLGRRYLEGAVNERFEVTTQSPSSARPGSRTVSTTAWRGFGVPLQRVRP